MTHSCQIKTGVQQEAQSFSHLAIHKEVFQIGRINSSVSSPPRHNPSKFFNDVIVATNGLVFRDNCDSPCDFDEVTHCGAAAGSRCTRSENKHMMCHSASVSNLLNRPRIAHGLRFFTPRLSESASESERWDVWSHHFARVPHIVLNIVTHAV